MILSSVAGLAYTALIPFILYSLEVDFKYYLNDTDFVYSFFNSPTAQLAILFTVFVGSIVFFKTVSMLISDLIGAKATALLRIDLSRKINAASISDIEAIGYAKLTNLINIDAQRVTGAALAIPNIWVGIVTVVGVLGYLAYIKASVFILVIISLVVAIITYQLPISLAGRAMQLVRKKEDEIQTGCRGLILGAKELKLDVEKSQSYIEKEIIRPEMERRSSYFKGMTLFLLAQNYGETIVMLVIGIVVFYIPYVYDINQLELFATVMALLYLTGPVSMILSELSDLTTGKISLKKINEIYALANKEKNHIGLEFNGDWKQLQLRNIGYSYKKTDNPFSISSVDVNINKGDITFIVGGNGSGKSTLSKVISTHYAFSEGDMLFDGKSIGEYSLNSVRKNISAIYTDFFLFPRVYADVDSEKANQLLEYLKIDHKVTLQEGLFSDTSLSDGQRKRVALMNAMLDNRQIYLFDEWAADQDPEFKEVFYYKILPRLKSENKAVIVISHDDRYFSVADKIVVMEDGLVREIKSQDSFELGEAV
jgi:putative ATP-binding cassette transporter